jgi:hypothetical protein
MKLWILKCELSDELKAFQLKDTESQAFKEFCDMILKIDKTNGALDNTEVIEMDGPKLADLTHCWSGSLVITNEKTLDIMMELSKDAVEFVPLKCDEKKLYMLHVIKALDIVDYDKCEYRKSFISNRKGTIKKFAFFEEKINDCDDIFRINVGKGVYPDIIVSKKFKDYIEHEKLSGFRFVEVWDSEIE